MTIHFINGIKVRTHHEYPPIPIRSFDWSAVDDNTYDGEGCPVGRGATEQEAINDLLAQMDERGELHASGCALHNAPALPVGPCDCGVDALSNTNTNTNTSTNTNTDYDHQLETVAREMKEEVTCPSKT